MTFLYLYLIALFIGPQQWIPPFIGWPVDYIIYPTWFIYLAASGRFARLRLCTADYFLMTFIVWIVISLLVNGYAHNVVPVITKAYGKWLALYLMIRATVDTDARLRSAAAFTTFLVYILVIEGIQHKLSPNGINWAGQSLGWVDPSVLAAGGSGRTKWVGVFDGIGVFCVAYTISLPFVLQYASSGFSKSVLWLNRLCLPFLFLAIYYTGSRGGLLATLSLISLHLAMKYKISFKTIAISAAIVFLAFAVAPSHLTQTHDSSNSAQNRIDVWAQGLGMLMQNPIFGVGRGNFLSYTRTIIAHNSGVEILAETGMIGLFLWISMIVACLRAANLRLKASDSIVERNILIGTILCVLGYLISSLFVTLEYETFYMLLALCVGGYQSAIHGPLYRGREFWTSASIVIVFVVVIKGVVSVY